MARLLIYLLLIPLGCYFFQVTFPNYTQIPVICIRKQNCGRDNPIVISFSLAIHYNGNLKKKIHSSQFIFFRTILKLMCSPLLMYQTGWY